MPNYVFVAYGRGPAEVRWEPSGVVREQGYKVGLIRPITTWPFPENAFREVNAKVKAMITVEANATGQLVDDVAHLHKKNNKERCTCICASICLRCAPHEGDPE